MDKRNYALTDILKIVFAVLVVLLHSQQKSGLYLNLHSVQGAAYLFVFQILARIAVPFFFVTSSLFLYKGIKQNGNEKERIFSYCKRLLTLYLVWFVLYFIYIIKRKLGIPDDFSFKAIALLIRDIILSNGFPASWYLIASVIDSLIILLLTKIDKGRNRLAVIVSVICYVICLLMTFYNFLVCDSLNSIFAQINNVFGYFYISFPYGLIYFMAGKLIAENEERIKASLNKRIAWFFTAFALLITEVFGLIYLVPGFHTNSYTTYLMLPFAAVSLVLVCLICDLDYKPIYQDFRKASTIIYCSHGFPLWVMGKYVASSESLTVLSKFVIMFLVTIMLCGFLSLIVIRLSKKYKILRYLY